MILLVACTCSGVNPLIRSVLKEANHPNWLEEPIYQGKTKVLDILSQFPDYYKTLPEYGALLDSINNRSSFAVVIGYDEDRFKWADVAMGDIRSKLDAGVIVSHFANIK